ncbi:Hypothetical protein CINCED_3A010590 [Cinara cedri]|uniref:Uncharacterized protein n=1 Tax=Cinara cedri TaxID=506608 RepID=A0A5E4M0M4_9HEMI|nr:Hypothetical protein CINCED_3A010590 [Cinara cedri]
MVVTIDDFMCWNKESELESRGIIWDFKLQKSKEIGYIGYKSSLKELLRNPSQFYHGGWLAFVCLNNRGA